MGNRGKNGVEVLDARDKAVAMKKMYFFRKICEKCK